MTILMYRIWWTCAVMSLIGSNSQVTSTAKSDKTKSWGTKIAEGQVWLLFQWNRLIMPAQSPMLIVWLKDNPFVRRSGKLSWLRRMRSPANFPLCRWQTGFNWRCCFINLARWRHLVERLARSGMEEIIKPVLPENWLTKILYSISTPPESSLLWRTCRRLWTDRRKTHCWYLVRYGASRYGAFSGKKILLKWIDQQLMPVVMSQKCGCSRSGWSLVKFRFLMRLALLNQLSISVTGTNKIPEETIEFTNPWTFPINSMRNYHWTGFDSSRYTKNRSLWTHGREDEISLGKNRWSRNTETKLRKYNRIEKKMTQQI